MRHVTPWGQPFLHAVVSCLQAATFEDKSIILLVTVLCCQQPAPIKLLCVVHRRQGRA